MLSGSIQYATMRFVRPASDFSQQISMLECHGNAKKGRVGTIRQAVDGGVAGSTIWNRNVVQINKLGCKIRGRSLVHLLPSSGPFSVLMPCPLQVLCIRAGPTKNVTEMGKEKKERALSITVQ